MHAKEFCKACNERRKSPGFDPVGLQSCDIISEFYISCSARGLISCSALGAYRVRREVFDIVFGVSSV